MSEVKVEIEDCDSTERCQGSCAKCTERNSEESARSSNGLLENQQNPEKIREALKSFFMNPVEKWKKRKR